MTNTPDINELIKDAHQFLDTHKNWEHLTREEIDFLRVRNFKSAESVMKIKRAIVERYQNQLKVLFDQKEMLMQFPDALKNALKQSQMAFEELSAEYTQELELALDSATRMVTFIRNAITTNNTSSLFYGKSGAMERAPDPRAMTYNSKA